MFLGKKKRKLQFKKKVEPERFNQEKKKVSLHFIKKENKKKQKGKKVSLDTLFLL